MIKNLFTKTESQQNRTKKLFVAVLSVLLTIAMLATLLSIYSANASSFSPRLSAPDSSNPYYTTNNIYYQHGYGMPNCTCYAWGRAYEILGSAPDLPEASAGSWYSSNKNSGAYPYGSSPKLGAIACWSHHVAVVEQISGGEVTISESHASGTYFDTYTLTIGDEGSYAGSFYGYIYILNGTSSSTEVEANEYTTGYYTVDTGTSVLNMRSGAGSNYAKVGEIPSGETVKVTEVSGYWGKTTYNGVTGWIALWYCNKVTTTKSLFKTSDSSNESTTDVKDTASLVKLSQEEETTEADDSTVGWVIHYFLPSLL